MRDSETVVSKFQQEVFDSVKQIDGSKADFNCHKYGIEKDIVMRSTKRDLAIEVNGVFHYPRNSEEKLGKD